MKAEGTVGAPTCYLSYDDYINVILEATELRQFVTKLKWLKIQLLQ
jgi:hypothetical protein